MANTEAGWVNLGLHLNSKPAERQMSGMRSRFSSMGSRLGDAIKGSMTRSFSGIGSSFSSMLTKVLSAAAVTAFTKKCLDLGSDLAEVQNVVDVTFSSMSGNVDAFAKGAAVSFGLSETMAKQFTGTFGAMAKAFGFTEAKAYDMSTTLTGLAGDVASFYNLDQEEAFTKLKAIFTGETEGLKSLGVVMTQTALDQFAMEKGFGKTTAAMTEQEKAALRYEFVLDKLSGASGDFARTSDGWANQVRLLKLQFDSLRAAIGEGLIAALSPAIKALNGFMGALVKAANTFKSFVYSLMGKKSEDMAAGAGAVAGALSDLTGGAGAAADSLGGVGDAATGAGKSASAAAQEIRRSLAGFDEITKLTDPSSGGGGGGSGGSGGIGSAIAGELGDVSSALKGEEFDVGNTIADFLANAVKSGDWQALGQTLGEKVNSAIEKIPWATAGAKFGSGINGIISTTYWALDEINFTNIGSSIATFVNNAIGNIDFDIAGRLKVKKLTSILDTIMGFLGGLEWGQIGTAVSDYFSGALAEVTDWLKSKDWAQIGQNIMSNFQAFLNGIDTDDLSEKISNFFTTLFASAADLLANIDIGEMVTGFNSLVNSIIAGIDWGQVLANLCRFLLEVLKEIPGIIISSYSAPADLIDRLLGGDTFFGKISDTLNGISEWFNNIDLNPEHLLYSLLSLHAKLQDWWAGVKQMCVNALNGIITTLNDMLANITGALSNTAAGQWLAEKLGLGSLDEIRIPLVADIDPPPGWYTEQFEQNWNDKFSDPLEVKGNAIIDDATVDLKEKPWAYADAQFDASGFAPSWQKPNAYTTALFWGHDFDRRWTKPNAWTTALFWGHDFDKKWSKPKIYADAYFDKGYAKAVGGGWYRTVMALGGVYSGGMWKNIPQYAGGTADAHGSMFVAGEAGPEVVGHIGGRTEVLNRSQLAATMSYAVSTGMAVGTRSVLANATPRLAIIGQSVTRGEEHLAQLAQRAADEAAAGGTARVIELLAQILAAILSLDLDIQLDGASVKDRIVELINRHTQATGVCEIMV